MDLIHEGPGYVVRRAGPADNAALCEVVRKVHMHGALDVTQERDPDFFALLRMHDAEHEVWVIENRAGSIGACGSVVVRPGWVNGAVRRVGYLSDLRVVPGHRAARGLSTGYRKVLEHVRDTMGADLFYTVIFDDNELARRTLVERKGARRSVQPDYAVMTPFNMTSVQFTRPKKGPSRPIRRATTNDLDALVAFLSSRAKTRVMGEVLDEARLVRRFELWPDFGIESFFLAHDAGGRIIGTIAPWNTHAFKRTRVLGYHQHMRWVKMAFDLGAAVFRYPPLPDPDDCFDFAFLSHVEVDDPAVFRDLLLAAYGALRPERLHFLSAMIPVGDPLASAFGRLTVNRTAMTVYSVTLGGGSATPPDLRTLRPGFEMALS